MRVDTHYILDKDRNIVPATLMEWAKWFETADRHVAKTTLSDGTFISTVFLGLDHRFTGDGPPLLFETMVFPSADNPAEEYMERYTTWDDAVAGHMRALEWALDRKAEKLEEETK